MNTTNLTPSERADLARWVVAMRRAHTGGVPQVRSALHHRGGGYCCLGLWCEIAQARGDVERRGDVPGECRVSWRSADDADAAWNSTTLPRTARLVGDNDPHVLVTDKPDRDNGDDISYSASAANDEQELTFDQIADCVVWTYGITPDELAIAEQAPVVEIENGAQL